MFEPQICGPLNSKQEQLVLAAFRNFNRAQPIGCAFVIAECNMEHPLARWAAIATIFTAIVTVIILAIMLIDMNNVSERSPPIVESEKQPEQIEQQDG